MPATTPNYVADGTINVSRFVKSAGTTKAFRLLQAGAGEVCCGISQEGPKAPPTPGASAVIAAVQNDPIKIYDIGEECLVSAGAAFSVGDYLKSDANGQAIVQTGAGQNIGAQALEDATAINQLVRVKVVQMTN